MSSIRSVSVVGAAGWWRGSGWNRVASHRVDVAEVVGVAAGVAVVDIDGVGVVDVVVGEAEPE